MAIYHFSGQIIGRSQGRSAVAAAAYRAAERLADERTLLTHDFLKKEPDILHKEILLPKNAPEKLKDRATLWNEVEQTEKRKDAQLCREINVSLPQELTYEQNLKLAREFVQTEFVDKGMVADMCMHRGHKSNEEQPHIHVMLTLREVKEDGCFGKKVREWNSRELLTNWREAWANEANRHLGLNGIDMRIDHRTLEDQGIALEPQNKIGPKASLGHEERVVKHQEIARRNGERLLDDPKIVIEVLTNQQSTFTHHDIARVVNRYTDDKEQFTQVYEAVKALPELVLLGKDDRGRERFSTKEMLALEQKLLTKAIDKAEHGKHKVNPYIQEKVLNSSNLTDEQKTAYQHITDNRDVACVIGFAGTGKSYMLGVAREAWEEAGYRPVGMTLSGIAAENLEGGSGIQSRTVASHLLAWKHGREKLTSRDIVVVDEAAMLGTKQMAKIIDEVDRANAKAILVFDPEQLPAIEAGAPARAISERVGYVEMRDIRRQKEEWQKEATISFGTHNTTEGLLAYEEHNNVHSFNNKPDAMAAMIERWDEVRANQPDKTLFMMAYTRAEVKELNDRAREVKKSYKELANEQTIETARGSREFAAGDRIYFLKNEYNELKVKNGTLGTIEAIQDNNLMVKLDAQELEQGRTVKVNLNSYNHIDHGYAATVHKGQGVTVDRSYVLASKYFDRHSTYVAMSRHRESTDLFYSKEDFQDFGQMAKELGRERSKDMVLDYADVRNLEIPDKLLEKQYQRDNLQVEPDVLKTQARLAAANERIQDRQLSFKEGYQQLLDQKNGVQPLSYEQQAQAAERKFAEMEQNLSRSMFPNSDKQRLEKYAATVTQQPELMHYIKEHSQEVADKMQQMSEKLEKAHTMDSLERSRDD